jgi:integrase/recombinase XerD
MSALSEALQEYLQLRRALGFKLEREGLLLPQFLSFLEQQGAARITSSLAMRWAMTPSTASPRWWAVRLGWVRGFAKYVAAHDPCNEVPSRELLPMRPSRRLVPFVYSDADVVALMRAADSFDGLKRATYATLFGLLAATGIRVGEAISLDRDDIKWQAQLLVIRSGKFGKSRELVLHPTTINALRAYVRLRDRALPHPRSQALLLSLAGTRLLYKNVHRGFSRLLPHAAFTQGLARAPRLHDLRHAFAIKTLVRWYQEGLNVEARLPLLSTYLGHVNPSQTYWYLTATPELMRLAERCARNTLRRRP